MCVWGGGEMCEGGGSQQIVWLVIRGTGKYNRCTAFLPGYASSVFCERSIKVINTQYYIGYINNMLAPVLDHITV